MDNLIIGDCIEELSKLDNNIAQLVVADAPYYNVLQKEEWDCQWKTEREYLEWTAEWVSHCIRVLKEDGLLYIFGQVGKREKVFLHVMSDMAKKYYFHDLIIWDRAVGYNDRKDSFTPAYEMILALRKNTGSVYFNKDAVREPYDLPTISKYKKDKRYKDEIARVKHLNLGKYATNLWRIASLKGSSKEKVGHPSQKPEKLVERLILSSSKKDDLVIDPFIGSGTTAIVAERLGRKWIGIDTSEEYIKMTEKRLNNEN